MSTDTADLERALRRTLTDRAGSVPDATTAQLLGRLPATAPSGRPRRRGVGWLAAAGAAAATAVAIGVVAWLAPIPDERPVATPQPSVPALPTYGQEPVVLGGETLDGTTVSTRQFAGRPLLLVFWASWCRVCQDQAGLVEEYVESADASADLAVLGIASRDFRRSAQYVQGDLGLSYPSILDRTGEVARLLGVGGFPVTMLLGGDGRIIQQWPGLTADLSRVSDALEASAGDSGSEVFRETFGPGWPLTVDDGVLRCEAGRVPVVVADGRSLALEAPDLTDPLWDTVAEGGEQPAVDELRDQALDLCGS